MDLLVDSFIKWHNGLTIDLQILVCFDKIVVTLIHMSIPSQMSTSTNKKTTHLTIRISPEQLQEVKDFAVAQDMSFTDFVLEALAEKMGKENDRDRRLRELERAVFKQTNVA